MQTTAVVDRDTERAYILGGHDCSYHRAEVRVYVPSSNSWTYISNLPFSSRGVAAAIIRQENDEKWIMALRNAHTFFYQIFKQSMDPEGRTQNTEGPRRTQLDKADWSSSNRSLKLFKLIQI